MDFVTIIIALIIILVCVVPFIIMGRNNKKKERQFLETLSSLAGKYNATVSQYDIWNHTAIGADEGMNMIFFTKKSKNATSLQQVAIAEIQKCRVVNTSRSVSHNNSNTAVIDKLELAFQYQDRNRAELFLNFFDVNTDSLTVSRELHLADKWCKLVNDRIGALTKKGVAVN
jgi:hypothetical protein